MHKEPHTIALDMEEAGDARRCKDATRVHEEQHTIALGMEEARDASSKDATRVH